MSSETFTRTWTIERVIMIESRPAMSIRLELATGEMQADDHRRATGVAVRSHARKWFLAYARRRLAAGAHASGKYDVIVGPGALQHAKGVMLYTKTPRKQSAEID